MVDAIGLTLYDANVLAEPLNLCVYGPPGTRKCLASGTPVPLADGRVVPIEAIQDGDVVISLDHTLKTRTLPAVRAIPTGVKKLYLLHLKGGADLTLTKEHPLYTRDGWRAVGDLRPGDMVATPRALPFFGRRHESEARVKFLAYHLANGHTSSSTIGFTSGNAEIVAEWKACVEAIGSGWTQALCHGKPTLNYRVVGTPRFSHSTAAQLLDEWGLTHKHAAGKFVPAWVFELQKPLLALFLNRYLTCDGCSSRDRRARRVLSFSSASETMLRQMSHLLLRFGVRGRISSRVVKGRRYWDWASRDRESVDAFQDIGMLTKQTTPDEKRGALSHNDVIPFTNTEMFPSMPADHRPGRASGAARLSRAIAQQYADLGDFLHMHAHSDIYWAEVGSLTPCGRGRVYDIEVPGLHNFVAGDVFVHNSSQIAHSFNDCLYVVTNPKALRPFASWCRDNWSKKDGPDAVGMRTPIYPTVAKPDPRDKSHWGPRSWENGGMAIKQFPTVDGAGQVINAMDTLKKLVDMIASAEVDGGVPYSGYILDEWSDIFARVENGITTQGWARWRILGGVQQMMKDLCTSVGKTFVFVCHAKDPVWEETDKEGNILRRAEGGTPLLAGGPMLPFRNLMHDTDAFFDIVVRSVVSRMGLTAEQKHKWQCQYDGTWYAKWRDMSVKLEETASLRELLIRSGSI